MAVTLSDAQLSASMMLSGSRLALRLTPHLSLSWAGFSDSRQWRVQSSSAAYTGRLRRP